ncbi:siderophore-interacting protein [Nitriliruptoraceae bacterium ZYF776]|nr:siderophore-interacting protein [Profundirhabdus halotolerans]
MATDSTTAERDARQLAATRTFLTEVVAVEDVHRDLRQVTFAGGDLVDFAPLGPDTFVYVLLPPPGRDALTIGRDFTWQAYQQLPVDERPVGAYYTVRRWRPAASELVAQFALHEPAGAATAWVRHARPGDPVALWGPRACFDPPADTAWYLLVADDTGLPAVAAILEDLPREVPVRVVAEVDTPDTEPRLPLRADVEVVWVHRRGAPAGTRADAVARALAALPEPPEGHGYVWAGAEDGIVKATRRHARDVLGLTGERADLTPYWRRDHAGDD